MTARIGLRVGVGSRNHARLLFGGGRRRRAPGETRTRRCSIKLGSDRGLIDWGKHCALAAPAGIGQEATLRGNDVARPQCRIAGRLERR